VRLLRAKNINPIKFTGSTAVDGQKRNATGDAHAELYPMWLSQRRRRAILRELRGTNVCRGNSKSADRF
jgi:hypothetical protein